MPPETETTGPSVGPSAGPIVGIDLGTTNSLVAVHEPGGPRILAPSDAEALMPSAVRYEPDGSVVVGAEARAGAIASPRRTITSIKRLMGRSRADAEPDLPYLSYSVVEGPNRTARVALPDGRVISPPEVSAEILRALKRRAEAALGVPVERAVVTVPAYFDDAQRQATRDAGRLAGLEVVRIVNEPTAAALAYGLGASRSPRTIAVYDLGGGTFDVSILRVTPADGDAGSAFFQVLSTAGDTRLGGDDIDQRLVRMFMEEISAAAGIDGTIADADAFSPETRRALLSFAEAVKIRLSAEERAAISIDLGEGRLYARTVTRDELEAMMNPWVERTIEACGRAVRAAQRAAGSALAIDAVVMVGGSTRVPLVRRRAGEFFGLEPYTALDPDRVVALGAAVQAGIMSGAVGGSLLLDVIPLSLGIETMGGAVAKLIVANSTVPARATEMFSTSADGQTSIRLSVYQGEREMAEDCRLLGEFRLSGLPPMPAGIPQLEVEFAVDASGVLSVRAHERRSGKRATLQVVPNHGLTREEVDRIERDSLTHARDDMTRHRVVDLAVNSALDLKWIGERFARYSDRLDPASRDDLARRIALLRELVDRANADWRSVDPQAFADAKNALDHASIRLQEIGISESLRGDEAPR